uniref:Uncharacterized protein n=1 Tax=Caenorhabditis japonica TaxID=281687 RepID=A0A8R1IQH0_CAEJA
MFKKEHEAGDREKAATEEERVDKLEWIQERMRDDFSANSYLRAQFRFPSFMNPASGEMGAEQASERGIV